MMRHPVTGKDKSSFGVIAHQVLKLNILSYARLISIYLNWLKIFRKTLGYR